MEELISFLNKLHPHPLPGPLEAEVRNRFHPVQKKKNEYLLHEGEVCRYGWYLQKGLVRCYYERDEREVTTWFMEEDNMVVLIKSLSGQRKSLYNIQAMEDCELYRIGYHDILYLLESYPEARYIRTKISDRYSTLKDIKIRATNMLSAKERYRYFEKHFPHLLGRLNLQHIASYLDLSLRSVKRARGS